MAELRVDVRVSGDDGVRMVRSFSAAGLSARLVESEGVEAERARVVVVEVGAAAEVARVLRELRATAHGAPPTVVLIGPEGADASEYAAADAFYARPLALSEIVRAVQRFLAADRDARRQDRSERGSARHVATGRGGVSPPAAHAERPRSDRPGSRASRQGRLSAPFEALLAEADRRLFPTEEPLTFELPGTDDGPEELVPDELLVSPPPVPQDSPPFGNPSVSHGETEATTGGWRTTQGAEEGSLVSAEDSTASGPTEPAGAEREAHPEPWAATALVERRSALRAEMRLLEPRSGGALLLSMVGRSMPQRLTWRADETARSLVVWRGVVVAYEGPLDLEAARRLAAEGRLTQPPSHAEEAKHALERATAEGALRASDRVRCRREVVEDVVRAMATASASAIEIEPGDPSVGDVPLTRTIRELVVEAFKAKRSAQVDSARPGDALHFRKGGELGLAGLGLLPEDVAELEAFAGIPLEALRASPTAAARLGGLVDLLIDAGFASIGPSDARAWTTEASAVRGYLSVLAARASEGTYFEILGLDPGADGRAVEAARARLVEELEGLDLPGLGLASSESDRKAALEATEEAYAALASARLRARYSAALAAPQGGR